MIPYTVHTTHDTRRREQRRRYGTTGRDGLKNDKTITTVEKFPGNKKIPRLLQIQKMKMRILLLYHAPVEHSLEGRTN